MRWSEPASYTVLYRINASFEYQPSGVCAIGLLTRICRRSTICEIFLYLSDFELIFSTSSRYEIGAPFERRHFVGWEPTPACAFLASLDHIMGIQTINFQIPNFQVHGTFISGTFQSHIVLCAPVLQKCEIQHVLCTFSLPEMLVYGVKFHHKWSNWGRQHNSVQ